MQTYHVEFEFENSIHNRAAVLNVLEGDRTPRSVVGFGSRLIVQMRLNHIEEAHFKRAFAKAGLQFTVKQKT